MKNITALFITMAIGLTIASNVSGQFNVKIPKLPKSKEQPRSEQQVTSTETKKESTVTTERTAETTKAASQATAPYITLNSMVIKALTTSYWPTSNKKTLVWMPSISFIINGPIKSGDRLRVEYSYPGKPNWLWCEPYTEQLEPGHWLSTECDGRFDESLGSNYTGPVNFTIGMFNELAGTKSEVFKGSFNVEKAKPNAPDSPSDFVYYVNYDWNIPISYVWLHQDSVYGARLTKLNISFWTRGSDYASAMDPHIFYQGKEISSQHSCDESLLVETTQYVAASVNPKPIWKRFNCEFYQIFGTDSSGGGVSGQTHRMDQNPGEYEFKLLRTGRLARSIKFTVKADGNIDNGIAGSNKIGTWWTIVPATVIGDQDGAYDKNAYKTGAFWGHPLTGFTAN